MKQRYIWSLVLLCTVCVFAVRLWLSITTPEFADDISYQQARYLEYLVEHGQPMEQDPLSYGGRQATQSVYTTFLLPFAQVVDATFAIKLVSALIGALLIPCVFLVAVLITKSPLAASLSAVAAALSPAMTTITLNTGQSMGLALLLVTLVLFLTIKSAQVPSKKRWIYATAGLVAYVAALVVSVSVIVFLFGMALFLLIVKTERKVVPKIYLEFWFIALVLTVWYTLLVYGDVLMLHGWDIFYQNVPFDLRTAWLLQENIFWLLASLGIILCLAGVYAFFKEIHNPSLRGVIFVSMFGLAPLLLGTITVLSVQAASAYLALAVSILVAPAYLHLKKYLAKTKAQTMHTHFFLLSLAIIVASLAIPFTVTTLQNTPQEGFDEEAISFLQTYAENNILFVDIAVAHEVMYKTNTPTAMDTDFLRIADIEEKYSALQSISTSLLINDVVESLNKLGSSRKRPALIITPTTLRVTTDTQCLTLIHETQHHLIYESPCEVIIRE